MSRPKKFRRVEFLPKTNIFVPQNISKSTEKEVIIKIEELEAMRLKDIEKLTQQECAKRMNISRQTFQNIIDSAREKVATALTEGNTIKIRGGHFTTDFCKIKCYSCGNIYGLKNEPDKEQCPYCGSEDITCSKKLKGCRKWCCKK